MSEIKVIMPKMGESVAEATIIKWVKNIGDHIDIDETIVEIATDKVDSEIPSEKKGILKKILYKENDVVKVGEVIAIIEGPDSQDTNKIPQKDKPPLDENVNIVIKNNEQNNMSTQTNIEIESVKESPLHKSKNKIFLSPLVKSIIKKEDLSSTELDNIYGTGKSGRITKKDIIEYLNNKNQSSIEKGAIATNEPNNNISHNNFMREDVEIIEMDRMRKLIAKHMTASKSISAHVTSFVEADVSKIVAWRSRIKDRFFNREGQKITYTPIIFESVIKSILDFPLINISVDNDNIIKHKNIHLGMATALPSGNLIVPVIKNAQEKNILGLTKSVNDLAKRARNKQLKPDETTGGTFTITNVGSFGSIMGTPIINQPQVAILALGKIQKKATVIETKDGDTIGIRSKMFLSLSYDHRVIDGALGGQFLQRIADYLESFDTSREI